MSFILPTGFNRADGVTPLPFQPQGAGGTPQPIGTPTPASAKLIQSALGNVQPINEESDSPEIERAEQATFQHRLTMQWDEAVQLIALIGRGTFLQDSFGNVTRVLSSRIQHLKADNAVLSITAESISFDSPPDEFQITPVELGIDIIKHPRYYYALYPTPTDYVTSAGDLTNPTITVAQVKQAVIRAIQTYRDSPYLPQVGQITFNGQVQNNIVANFINSIVPTLSNGATSETNVNISNSASCQLAVAAAAEIIQKLWNQEDNPYLTGFQITWSQYFFAPPPINGTLSFNPGGYVEDPLGIVPDYFMSPSQDGSDNIFQEFAEINPQSYSADGTPAGAVNISWLRKADEIEYQRTWFKMTRTWIGSPIGHFDAQLYQQGNRPSLISDYLPFAVNV